MAMKFFIQLKSIMINFKTFQRTTMGSSDGRILGPNIHPSKEVHYSLDFTAYKVASNMVSQMDGSSDQGFLPCSLLHRILWSPTSKENPFTCCLISCEAKGVVYLQTCFTAYKAASERVFFRCGTPKDAM